MGLRISQRAKRVPRSGIREMFDMAPKYKNVISLGIGEPGFPTPKHIVEAGANALYEGHTKYTPNAGISDLRKAIAERASLDGLSVDQQNVIITAGAGEAVLLALLATVDPGDEALLPDPCWPNYFGQVALSGARMNFVRTYERDHFHLKAEAIEKTISDRTRVVIINSPSNPTGAVLNKQELEDIAKVILDRDLVVISDETYSNILFDGRRHTCIASLPDMADHTIVINSFSKTYAMTGWRVGYAIGPSDAISQMAKLQESVSSCVNAAAQQACLAALKGPQDCVKEMVEGYRERRDLLLSGLAELPGIECLMPEGSFYAFPNITKFGLSSKDFALMLLEKTQVVVVPGSAFGEGGEGYLRVSFCGSIESIKEVLSRLQNLLR